MPQGLSTERVQKQKKYQCKEGSCRDAILSCNTVDVRLYNHYRAVFEATMARVPDRPAAVEAFQAKWRSRDDGAPRKGQYTLLDHLARELTTRGVRTPATVADGAHATRLGMGHARVGIRRMRHRCQHQVHGREGVN